MQLCKDLGADEVIDYRTTDLAQELRSRARAEGHAVFALVVDNVGEPHELYKAADEFLREGGKFVQVGSPLTFSGIYSILSRICWPALLGGGRRKLELLQVKSKEEDLRQIGKWMEQGQDGTRQVRAVIDETFELEDAARAYEKLKTRRTRGKIVVHVTEKP